MGEAGRSEDHQTGQRHVAWYLSLDPLLLGKGRMLTMTGAPGGRHWLSSLVITEARGTASAPPVHTWLMWNSTEAFEPCSNLDIKSEIIHSASAKKVFF